eukprot:9479663-Pyramimonas_sp.AAC.1
MEPSSLLRLGVPGLLPIPVVFRTGFLRSGIRSCVVALRAGRGQVELPDVLNRTGYGPAAPRDPRGFRIPDPGTQDRARAREKGEES